jgi:hypothetical protein
MSETTPTAERLTIPEATLLLLNRFEVMADVVNCTFDPAGSEYEYKPNASDVRVLEAFVGRPIGDSELLFVVGAGPYSRSRYCIGKDLRKELLAALESAQRRAERAIGLLRKAGPECLNTGRSNADRDRKCELAATISQFLCDLAALTDTQENPDAVS